jgi:hypothetical protein
MSTNIPGLILPTVQSYTPGAGNPRDSAMLATQAMNSKQNALSNSVGGRRSRKYKGGSDNIVVPQYQMLYPVQNGPGTTPNDQIVGLSSTGMQSASWSVNDNKAAIKGGRKGCWHCYRNKLRLSRLRTRRYKSKRRNKNNKRKTTRHH